MTIGKNKTQKALSIKDGFATKINFYWLVYHEANKKWFLERERIFITNITSQISKFSIKYQSLVSRIHPSNQWGEKDIWHMIENRQKALFKTNPATKNEE